MNSPPSPLTKLSKSRLEELCNKVDLPSSGIKATLVARLESGPKTLEQLLLKADLVEILTASGEIPHRRLKKAELLEAVMGEATEKPKPKKKSRKGTTKKELNKQIVHSPTSSPLAKLSKSRLEELCNKVDIPISGVKGTLVARLESGPQPLEKLLLKADLIEILTASGETPHRSSKKAELLELVLDLQNLSIESVKSPTTGRKKRSPGKAQTRINPPSPPGPVVGFKQAQTHSLCLFSWNVLVRDHSRENVERMLALMLQEKATVGCFQEVTSATAGLFRAYQDQIQNGGGWLVVHETEKDLSEMGSMRKMRNIIVHHRAHVSPWVAIPVSSHTTHEVKMTYPSVGFCGYMASARTGCATGGGGMDPLRVAVYTLHTPGSKSEVTKTELCRLLTNARYLAAGSWRTDRAFRGFQPHFVVIIGDANWKLLSRIAKEEVLKVAKKQGFDLCLPDAPTTTVEKRGVADVAFVYSSPDIALVARTIKVIPLQEKKGKKVKFGISDHQPIKLTLEWRA